MKVRYKHEGDYISLSDGGIIDNTALRVISELLANNYFKRLRGPQTRLVLIRVDASVPPTTQYNTSRKSPGVFGRTERSFDVTSQQVDKNLDEVIMERIDKKVEELDIVYRPIVLRLKDSALRSSLISNEDYANMDTSWSLEQHIVELLILAGRTLITSKLNSSEAGCRDTRVQEIQKWFDGKHSECSL